MSWQAINSIAIGVKHLEIGQSCQDWSACEIISEGNIIIGAVSDGMGSAKHSEIGSKLAVEIAISELRSWKWESLPKDEQDARNIFRRTLSSVKTVLNNKASIDGYSVEDLACTLLVFIASSKWVAAMQVGDGFIVVRSESRDYQLLFKPDKGEFANETTSITSSNASQEIKVCFQLVNCKFICAATDGIEDISLIKSDNWKPSEKFFKPLEEYMLSTHNLEMKKKELDKFLSSEKINQNTYDDKTLILCIYQEKQISENSSHKLTPLASSQIFDSIYPDIQRQSKHQNSINKKIKHNINNQYQQVLNQYIKIISYKIRDFLNHHSCQNVNFKFKISTNYLDILLESDQPIKCKKKLIIVINSTTLNSKYRKIKNIRVINILRGTSRFFWQKQIKR